jgi:hypothetical protein
MRYTIEGPDRSIKVHGLRDEPVTVAFLLHLPNASPRTAAIFGRYAASQWAKQPEYACFEAKEGSAIVRWTGSELILNTPEHLNNVLVGALKQQRARGESLQRPIWVVDADVSVLRA